MMSQSIGMFDPRASLTNSLLTIQAQQPSRRLGRPMLGVALVAALAVGGLATGPVAAAPIALGNASFETSTGTQSISGLNTSATLTGPWLARRTVLVVLAPDVGFSNSSFASDGNRIAFIDFGVLSAAAAGSFTQVTSSAWQPNTNYTVTVDIGQFGLAGVLTSDFGVALTSGPQGSETVVASADAGNLVSLLSGSGFTTYQFTFSTGAVAPSGNVGVRLFAGNLLSVASAVGFDNVRLDATPIPEPGTMMMGLAGLAVVSGLLRRRLRYRSVA